jgi:hypothetical protein
MKFLWFVDLSTGARAPVDVTVSQTKTAQRL